jgi:eukaryotic-like serine/threonine-protein kinase
MDALRWQRIKATFQSTVECAPSEREAALTVACAGDIELRQEVERLLRADEDAGDFLDVSPVADFDLSALIPSDEPDEAPPPSRIGPYRIGRELGRGGMGTVYLGEREEAGFQQVVAIKVVRHGMRSDLVLRRFRTERQILAALAHPGIARLYDGGTTEDGFPYFVMEYVAGEDVVAYCDAQRLSLPDRLRLFRRICNAVQFAHQSFIVHRDLKPSNILVTAEGNPKLLDFGIAKLLTSQPGGDEPATTTVARVMTLAYASPEQIRGEGVTTASDVYSLGMILYQLLSGRRPYRLRSRRAAEVERAIFEQEPEAPSAVVTRPETRPGPEGGEPVTIAPETASEQRQTTPRRLQRTLRRDLDNIVLKALQKDAARRYATAVELGDELGRYLEGRPVHAQPDRRSYRLAKFVRRHRVAVAAIVAAVLALLIGLAVALWQAKVARAEREVAQRRFHEARRLIATVISDIQPRLGAVPGTTALRKTLIDSTLLYLEMLARDAGDSPELLRDLVDSYVQLANIQGDAAQSNLGDARAAADSVRRAEVLARRLLVLEPNDPRSLRTSIDLHVKLFSTSVERDATQAQVHARHAVELAQRWMALQPRDPAARKSYAKTLFWLARASPSIEAYDRSREVYESLLQEKPGDLELLRNIALMHRYAAGLYMDKGDIRGSLDRTSKALAIGERRLAAQPASPVSQMDLALDLSQLSGARDALGDLPGALVAIERSVAMRERILALDKADVRASDRLAYALVSQGRLRAKAGHSERARRDYERAIGIYAGLPAGYGIRQKLSQLADTRLGLARIEKGRGRRVAACRSYRESARLFGELRAVPRADGPPGLTPSEERGRADSAREIATCAASGSR